MYATRGAEARKLETSPYSENRRFFDAPKNAIFNSKQGFINYAHKRTDFD